jgi:large subunit ribosomal protein L15
MQINNLKLKIKRKKRKTVGRGGKKGTYCGKGNKGQKARSGAHVDPLFEGGRSTLIDHMKKKKGFISKKLKKNIITLTELEDNFKDGESVSFDSLVKNKLVSKVNVKNGVKILGNGKLTKKLTIEKGILMSAEAQKLIEIVGGKKVEK